MNQIELRNASFKYPNGFLANDGLSLIVNQGERVAIVGQNGAGKTTAVKMMNGLHKPCEGDVIVNGKNTKDFTTAQIARHVGYVFQNPDDQIFNQTVYDEIAYMPKYYKMDEKEIKEKVQAVAKLLQIERFLKSNPLETPYTIRKFVTIAAILVTEPEYIILDEPTAGQDLRGIEVLVKVMDVLKEKGVGVITITHDMEFVANNFKRVVAMANKKIVLDGDVRECFANDDVLAACKIKRPHIGEIAKQIGLGKDILNAKEFVERYQQVQG